MHTLYIIVRNDDKEQYVTLRKNGWEFVIAFTEKEKADEYHLTLEHKDDVYVTDINSTYLSFTARAIMINGTPVLVAGNSAGENTLSTYAPTPTLYGGISTIWHYVQVGGQDYRTPDGALVVHISASTLLARLYTYFPAFNEHLMNDDVEVKCIMFKDLVRKEEYVFADDEIYNLRIALAKSKAVRHMAEEEGEEDV
jgi:hypothetical protein